jgi:hypothetical protein
MNLKEKLELLYNDDSKHSRYQNIPNFVKKEIDYNEIIDESWRGDTSRYEYMVDAVDFSDQKKVADIGANTGFFTLSLANENKRSTFTAYEPNQSHSNFIETIADHFHMKNVSINNQSVGLNGIKEIDVYDILLFFNVIHHAGVDFDTDLVRDSKEGFSKYVLEYIDHMKHKTKLLLFQTGYNWGGDKTKPIIEVDQITEMIFFITDSFLKKEWHIKQIALYTKIGGKGKYVNMSEELLDEINNKQVNSSLYTKVKAVVDELKLIHNSEFYRRPIFILES